MEQKKDNKKTILMILILLAIIILIIIALGYLGKIENKQKIPTGNVDIFDIIFENNDKKEDTVTANIENADGDNKQENKKMTGKIRKSIQNGNKNNSNNNSNNDGSIVVKDNQGTWDNWTKLNIFKNSSYFVVKDKIAPASENSYQFVIRNDNDFDVQYDLNLKETNDYEINMKYRLKQNGEYVAGSDNKYVSYNELNQNNINLANKTHDVYTLDWKWVESDNDTEIGEKDIDVNYKLSLQILAMQI